MIRKPIEIVKKHRVRVGGTVRIGAGEKSVPVRPLTPSGTVPHEPMQARVVESNTDYTVIEVVCSCGQKTHIQCNYAGTAKSQ
jgi:hypothetical protein